MIESPHRDRSPVDAPVVSSVVSTAVVSTTPVAVVAASGSPDEGPEVVGSGLGRSGEAVGCMSVVSGSPGSLGESPAGHAADRRSQGRMKGRGWVRIVRAVD